jgi:hypothetical protein
MDERFSAAHDRSIQQRVAANVFRGPLESNPTAHFH